MEAVDVETSANAGASFVGRNAPGTSRLVIDEDRRIIVGATFVGPEIAESLHAATIAVAGEVPLERSSTPCRRSRPAARSGCTCSRSTAAERRSPARAQVIRRAFSSSRKSASKPGIWSSSSTLENGPERSRRASTLPVWVTESPSARSSS